MKVDRQQAETWAEWFSAMSDPTRILILNLLATAREPLSVGEIVEQVDVGQSTVSHHLRILAGTCFVLSEPEGTSNRYRINERCLDCFPSAAEVVMGRGPSTAPWIASMPPRRRHAAAVAGLLRLRTPQDQGVDMSVELPVAVIGAGPIGLAAAAHLTERGIPFVVVERGDAAGASIREWAHVRLFTPWASNVDGASKRLLEVTGWTAPPEGEHPTGGELVDRYLEPLSAVPEIGKALLTRRTVIAVTRGEESFVVTSDGPAGVEKTLARAVIDASGTWQQPNPLGADGRPAVGEVAAGRAVEYGIPDILGDDRSRYAGRRVAVIGSGHSAQNVVRDLAAINDAQPAITWVTRRNELRQTPDARTSQLPERSRLGAAASALVADGRVVLETGFPINEIRRTPHGLVLVAADARRLGPFDRLVAATGFRPDLGLLAALRVDLDPVLESPRALATLIDPNVHTCETVPPHGAAELRQPEPGLYVVGTKSYGRAPTFLLATGYEQVRSVVAELAGEHADARRRLADAVACRC